MACWGRGRGGGRGGQGLLWMMGEPVTALRRSRPSAQCSKGWEGRSIVEGGWEGVGQCQ